MNKLILCEGQTDAALLGYYLKKVAGWIDAREFVNRKVYKKAPPRPIITTIDNHQLIKRYEKDEDYLLICSVGGISRFQEFFEKKIAPQQRKEDTFEKISVVIDRDNHEIQEIEDFANSILKKLSPTTKLQTNRWVNCCYKNRFGQGNSFQALLVVVPKKGSGALETLMLKAIAENADKRKIVDKTRNFAKQIRIKEASSYITNDSLELKACWGLTWAVLFPETIFMPFNVQIEKFPWEQSQTLQDCFSKLIGI